MRMRSHHADEDLEFQIAPMIDVLLVILVFFIMITSASVLRGDQDINLPVAENASKPEEAEGEAILNLHWEGRTGWVVMDATRYDRMEALEKRLASMSRDVPKFRVIIRADRTLPAFFVQRVLEACAQGGVSETVFSALNHG